MLIKMKTSWTCSMSHFFWFSECISTSVAYMKYTRYVVLKVFVVLPPGEKHSTDELRVKTFTSCLTLKYIVLNRRPLLRHSQSFTQKWTTQLKQNFCKARMLVIFVNEETSPKFMSPNIYAHNLEMLTC